MINAKTLQTARQAFVARGETIQEWAIRHDLPPAIVYAVLAGKLQGKYGVAHKAAVLLGLKKGADK